MQPVGVHFDEGLDGSLRPGVVFQLCHHPYLEPSRATRYASGVATGRVQTSITQEWVAAMLQDWKLPITSVHLLQPRIRWHSDRWDMIVVEGEGEKWEFSPPPRGAPPPLPPPHGEDIMWGSALRPRKRARRAHVRQAPGAAPPLAAFPLADLFIPQPLADVEAEAEAAPAAEPAAAVTAAVAVDEGEDEGDFVDIEAELEQAIAEEEEDAALAELRRRRERVIDDEELSSDSEVESLAGSSSVHSSDYQSLGPESEASKFPLIDYILASIPLRSSSKFPSCLDLDRRHHRHDHRHPHDCTIATVIAVVNLMRTCICVFIVVIRASAWVSSSSPTDCRAFRQVIPTTLGHVATRVQLPDGALPGRNARS